MKKYLLLCTVVAFLMVVACGQNNEISNETENIAYTPYNAVVEYESGNLDSNSGETTEATEEIPQYNNTDDVPATAEQSFEHDRLARVTYGDNVAYIMATTNLGNPEWFPNPLAPIITDAMYRADIFVFEVEEDSREGFSEEETAHNTALMVLPDGLTLADILPEDTLSNFIVQTQTYGVAFNAVATFTPFTVLLLFDIDFMHSDGERAYSLEFYIRDFAVSNNRHIIGLTDGITLLDLILGIPLENQLSALDNFPDMATALSADENPFSLRLHNANYHLRTYDNAAGIAKLLTETIEPTTFFVTIVTDDGVTIDFEYVLSLLADKGFDMTYPLPQNQSSVLQSLALEGVHISSSDIQCEAELLYLAFLEAEDWLRVRCFQCCGELVPIHNCGNWRITDKNIFDFDGDGVLDLWFRAVWGEEDFISPRWSSSMTGFATIADGEVVLLSSGYTSGGSIGGDFVTFGYDQETSEYVLMLRGFMGGFGGNYNSANIYSMRNGELTRLYRIDNTFLGAAHNDGEDEHIFRVNGEEVSYEVYTRIANRFLQI
ncbi:MAG: TraB/GumN family protein [Defluviitaleaceae bacterium]|nr:TraB/GumN family protein [Defluviitaleaceae bacterium]